MNPLNAFGPPGHFRYLIPTRATTSPHSPVNCPKELLNKSLPPSRAYYTTVFGIVWGLGGSFKGQGSRRPRDTHRWK